MVKKISTMRSAVSTQITRVTDGQTDGICVAYTRYSIYAVASTKRGMKSMHIFLKLSGDYGEKDYVT